MSNKMKSAFTLAETLVTLAVIGVIAAMTVPGLQQHAQMQTNVAAAQKAFSTLSSVTKELRLEYGPIRMWDMSSPKAIAEMYKKKLNVIGAPQEEYTVRQLDGSERGDTAAAGMFDTESAFITADGMLYYIAKSTVDMTCKGDTAQDSCFHIEVDTNGSKGPNMIGMDILSFVVSPDGVYPHGAKDGTDATQCVKGSASGWSCTAKMIKDGKITWK